MSRRCYAETGSVECRLIRATQFANRNRRCFIRAPPTGSCTVIMPARRLAGGGGKLCRAQRQRSETYSKNSSTSALPSHLGKVRSIAMSMSVCLSARVSQKPQDRTSPNPCMLPAGARTRHHLTALRYVVWMTSCFHVMDPTVRHVYF